VKAKSGLLWRSGNSAYRIAVAEPFAVSFEHVAGQRFEPIDGRVARDVLARPHPLYEGLGRTSAERRRTYAALFDAPLEATFLDELRAATNGGWALGSERFKQRIAKALGRRVTPASPGRPSNERDDKRQTNLL
jgi:putative transposase